MKRKIYDNLLYWKNNRIKTPYMLIGARQTGKTYILTEFCQNEFENYVYINLDKAEDIKQIFEQTINPSEIIKNIEAILGIDINIENTVIFIDEIQVSERAISALKYFCESEEDYKIVVAGSALFFLSFCVSKNFIQGISANFPKNILTLDN